MKAYTLKKTGITEELHLFEGEMTTNGCTSQELSICGKRKKSESTGNVFTCADEDAARRECAQIGRKVCGICVSHLYATFK